MKCRRTAFAPVDLFIIISEGQAVLLSGTMEVSVLYCIVFIHFHSASQSMNLSEALLTTAIDTVLEFTRRCAQATVSEGLAQGPYVAARAGLEPTTLRSKGVDSTSAPRRPDSLGLHLIKIKIYETSRVIHRTPLPAV